MTEFSTRIIKGGALLSETRRLLELWDEQEDVASNLDRIRSRNLLGLPSRKRTEDTLRILRQRFIDPGPHVLRSLRSVSRDSAAFSDACYFEAARNDALLAFCAETILFNRWELGRDIVTAEDLEGALLIQSPDPDVKAWGEETLRRVVQGVLAALRDFGVLEGKANKSIAPPRLSFGGFAYAAGRLKQDGEADIPNSTLWRRWILDKDRVRSLFLEADRLGLLHYAEAGSATRVDWVYQDFEEIVNAAV